MKIRALLAVVLCALGLVFVVGCGNKSESSSKTEKSNDTPTEVCKKIIGAITKGDYDAASEFCHGAQKEEFKSIAREFKKLSEKDKKEELDRWGKRVWEYQDEKIDGDYATVNIIGVNCADIKAHLKKVDGEWKMITPADYEKETGKSR